MVVIAAEHEKNLATNELSIDVTGIANAEAQFNAQALSGKEHCLIPVERAVCARLSRFSQRTWLFGI